MFFLVCCLLFRLHQGHWVQSQHWLGERQDYTLSSLSFPLEFCFMKMCRSPLVFVYSINKNEIKLNLRKISECPLQSWASVLAVKSDYNKCCLQPWSRKASPACDPVRGERCQLLALTIPRHPPHPLTSCPNAFLIFVCFSAIWSPWWFKDSNKPVLFSEGLYW